MWCGVNLSDRELTDCGKNHSFKHIQSPHFGDFGTVFHLQPLFGD
jgi:hypothetical protein